MQASLLPAIRERLEQYLSGGTTLREFAAWFVPATWNVEQETDPVGHALTNEIYLRLAEYSNGHRTEAELDGRLTGLVEAVATA